MYSRTVFDRTCVPILALCSIACSESSPGASGSAPASSGSTLAAPPSASASAKPAPTYAPAADLDKEPFIEVTTDAITLDGVTVGRTKDIDRLTKIVPLYGTIKATRDEWKKQRPGTVFPGVARLRLPADTTVAVANSVMNSAAFAGCPRFKLEITGDEKRIYEVWSKVPPPPGSAPSKDTTLDVYLEGSKVVWKEGETVKHESKFDGVGKLGALVCKERLEHAPHQVPPLLQNIDAHIHAPLDRPVKELLPVITALQSCKRDAQVAGFPSEKVEAFSVNLSPRAD